MHTIFLMDPVLVKINKTSFSPNEKIKINGQVKNFHPGVPALLKIISEQYGNIVVIDQIDVNNDATFKAEIIMGGKLWNSFGKYVLEVFYGDKMNEADTSFNFGVEK